MPSCRGGGGTCGAVGLFEPQAATKRRSAPRAAIRSLMLCLRAKRRKGLRIRTEDSAGRLLCPLRMRLRERYWAFSGTRLLTRRVLEHLSATGSLFGQAIMVRSLPASPWPYSSRAGCDLIGTLVIPSHQRGFTRRRTNTAPDGRLMVWPVPSGAGHTIFRPGSRRNVTL